MRETLPPFSEKAKKLKLGIYEHYKGNRYLLLGVGRHSETLEELVFYQAVEGGALWARPLELFCDTIVFEGNQRARFSFIGAP